MQTTQRLTPPKQTPWGRRDNVTHLAEGIFFVSTPSHGGLWITQQRLSQMPDHLKSNKFTNGAQWFEEDCEYVRVVAAFPELFPKQDPENIKKCLREYCWKAYEAHYGETLNKGESYAKDRDIFNS